MSNNHTNIAVPPTVNYNHQRVVVTGANGFIGRRLVAGLIKANAKVTVLLRSKHGSRYFEACGAKIVICQLRGGPQLDAALKGHDILFHFAYDIRASGADNLAAFSALYGSAQRGGIKRIIHASSITVYDDWPAGNIAETSPVSTQSGGDYRQAKIAMEEQLLQGNMPAAILQPTIVYGPASPLWTYAPQAALRRGPVVLPDPVGTCAAVYVDDVAMAALRAGVLQDLGQERFIISGPDAPTWAEFYQAHVRLIGAGAVITEPKCNLEARLPGKDGASTNQTPSTAARISSGLRRMMGSRRFDKLTSKIRARLPGGPTYPDRHLLDLYVSRPIVSDALTRTRLGYEPAYALEAGMAAIAKSDRG